jgi:hypothetical protein
MWLGQQDTANYMLLHHLYPNSNWFLQFYQKPEKKINTGSSGTAKNQSDIPILIILATHSLAIQHTTF